MISLIVLKSKCCRCYQIINTLQFFLLISILLLKNTDYEEQCYFYFKKEVNILWLRLGIDPYTCFEGSHQRTFLNSVLQIIHKHIGRLISEQQILRWWYYFKKNGFVTAEMKYIKKKSKWMCVCVCVGGGCKLVNKHKHI